MDTSFSIAIHILILAAESDRAMSSAEIAKSVGGNATHVRRIAGQLRKGGLVDSRQGVTGFRLARSAGEITLMDVYRAVYGSDAVELFSIHRNPSDKCIVGRYIKPVLTDVFSVAGQELEQALQAQTLSQVIDRMRLCAQSDGVL